MFSFFKNLFDYSQKEVNRLQKKVAQINTLEDEVRVLKDEEFSKETAKLKTNSVWGKKT